MNTLQVKYKAMSPAIKTLHETDGKGAYTILDPEHREGPVWFVPATTRDTRHEVAAPRAVGPSGRTDLLRAEKTQRDRNDAQAPTVEQLFHWTVRSSDTLVSG
jgi:hypothetical protein